MSSKILSFANLLGVEQTNGIKKIKKTKIKK